MTGVDNSPMSGITYRDSGVDIDLKSRFIELLVSELKYRRRGGKSPVGSGHFTSAVPFGNMYLTLGTDGVGSKLQLAREMGIWDTVGIDCVAMNANDTICVGAEPLALVDYIALPAPDTSIASSIGRGLNAGASAAGAEIVGGEVAVLVDMVKEIDISASCLGAVDRKSLVTGRGIMPGDEIIGVASSGLHSNGFTLVRKLLRETGTSTGERFGGTTLGRELLRPTQIYVRPVLKALKRHRIRGMANITGGGFRNILRLKRGVRFSIDSLPTVPKIFGFLSDLGGVESAEMFQTFNMGTGFIMVAARGDGDDAARTLEDSGLRAGVIGHVEKGDGVVLTQYGVEYDRY